MRTVTPSPEPRVWEKAGWDRKPRNGHEWRLLQAGRPQPKQRGEEKPFRCRKFPSHRVYKTEYQDGREVRRCVVCGSSRQRAFYKANKGKHRVWSKDCRQRRKVFEPVFEDGYASVSATWLAEHPVQVAGLLTQGILIVEVYGEAAYEIHPLAEVRR